jgi:L-lactate dehydrogenase complex protein LldG
MSAARDAILGRIRAATSDVADVPSGHRSISPRRDADPGDGDRLAGRIADYGATGTRVPGQEAAIGAAIAAALHRHRAHRIAVPPDVPPSWLPQDVQVVPDDPPLDHGTLSTVDGVVTGCAMAIAETGTIVLDGGPAQGRRALTLLPDLHVCVVEVHRIVATVDDAIAALAGVRRPVTFISGPSATSDIELERVEGVHGPLRLEVLIAA